MAMPLQEVLERRFGVAEDDFAAALVEFADRSGALNVVDVRPTDYLGAPQQTALRKAGATLQPLRASELGPIAGLAAAHAELVATSLSVAAVAKRLGVDTSRVRQRIYARSLYAFKHRGAWLVPAFQVHRRKLVPGLDTVVAALSTELHPVAVTRWLTSRHRDLELDGAAVTPIEWLSSGAAPATVAELAAAIDQL